MKLLHKKRNRPEWKIIGCFSAGFTDQMTDGWKPAGWLFDFPSAPRRFPPDRTPTDIARLFLLSRSVLRRRQRKIPVSQPIEIPKDYAANGGKGYRPSGWNDRCLQFDVQGIPPEISPPLTIVRRSPRCRIAVVEVYELPSLEPRGATSEE
jgi:hypothetical protein